MLILRLQGWCRRHRVPYLHGCVWDRECRSYAAPPRINLFFGRLMVVIELPLPYRGFVFPEDSEFVEREWAWNRPGVWTQRSMEEK